MRTISFIFAAALIGASPALAETPTISCNQAKAQVSATGAAVVRSSANVFDRFVTDRRFCQATQITRIAFIETTDTAYCPVGYRCEERSSTRIER